jgi:hypothetical protein
VRLPAAIFLAFAVISCSDPATAPSSIDTATRIDVPRVLHIGQQVRATASVQLGRGGAQLLTTGWRSDHPEVAAITDQGVVTAVGIGRAVLSVASSGEARRQEVRIVPDFDGYWTGTYRISRCTPYPNDAFSSFCTGLDDTIARITFVLTQDDEFVTGTFATDDVTYPGFVVPIGENGVLEITSRAVTAPFRLTSAAWSLGSSRPGHLDGILVWLRAGFGGANGYAIAEGTVEMNR